MGSNDTTGAIINVSVKPWYTSKTVWLNVISAVIALGGSVQGAVPPQWLPLIGLAVGIGNVILRFLTNQPIQ